MVNIWFGKVVKRVLIYQMGVCLRSPSQTLPGGRALNPLFLIPPEGGNLRLNPKSSNATVQRSVKFPAHLANKSVGMTEKRASGSLVRGSFFLS